MAWPGKKITVRTRQGDISFQDYDRSRFGLGGSSPAEHQLFARGGHLWVREVQYGSDNPIDNVLGTLKVPPKKRESIVCPLEDVIEIIEN